MLIIILTIYFLAIIAFSLAKMPEIKNPKILFFKSLFPSWKLFDESIDTPVLLYRIKKLEQFGEWQICIPPFNTKWFHLFINPNGNFYLAYVSHIQQFLGELTDFDEKQLHLFHQTITYKTTENFVRFELQQKNIQSDFQFKISSIHFTNKFSFQVIEDIILSPTLNFQSAVME